MLNVHGGYRGSRCLSFSRIEVDEMKEDNYA